MDTTRRYLIDEIDDDFGPHAVKEYTELLMNSMAAIKGLEDAVFVHMTARSDLIYAPLYNISIAHH